MNPIKNEYIMFQRNLKRPSALGTMNVDEDKEPNGKHDEIKDASTLDHQTAAEEKLIKDTDTVISKSPQGNKFLSKIYIFINDFEMKQIFVFKKIVSINVIAMVPSLSNISKGLGGG